MTHTTTTETIVHFTPKSGNGKTGPIPVSTSAPNTCPDTCPLKAGGCYAKGGPLGMHWRKVGVDRGDSWQALCDSIAALPDGQVWRHNQAGDLPGENTRIDADALRALVVANHGRRGFTYTHKPVLDGSSTFAAANRAAIGAANAYGFTINLSADNLAHADQLADLNIAPVAVVLPAELERKSTGKGKAKVWTETLAEYRARTKDVKTPAGRHVPICPATYRDDMTCERCQMCAHQNRPPVGFPAHGASKRKASAIASGK